MGYRENITVALGVATYGSKGRESNEIAEGMGRDRCCNGSSANVQECTVPSKYCGEGKLEGTASHCTTNWHALNQHRLEGMVEVGKTEEERRKPHGSIGGESSR